MNGEKSNWMRVSKTRPCPVCVKPDWCLVAGPATNPTAAICQRVESDRLIARPGRERAGWLHVLREQDDWRRAEHRFVRVTRLMTTARSEIDFAMLVARYAAAADADRLQALADGLGLTAERLKLLRIGWAAVHRAWTFPMSDVDGNIRGIRLRLLDGRKLAVRGGHEGLFVPSDLTDAIAFDGGRLLIAEGPTDTAALLDLSFAAIGRPSCTGGVQLLIDLARRWQPAQVVIVSDSDAPGQRGAVSLASALVPYVPAVMVITPPSGIKDAREWIRHGATQYDIQEAIDAAAVLRLLVRAT